jgi:hypothetical protein
MTYREQIQRLIQVVDLAYDLAGALRDTAYGEEKEAFNTTRGSTANATSVLRMLDNSLDDNRAGMPMGDSFEKYIKKTLEI